MGEHSPAHSSVAKQAEQCPVKRTPAEHWSAKQGRNSIGRPSGEYPRQTQQGRTRSAQASKVHYS